MIEKGTLVSLTLLILCGYMCSASLAADSNSHVLQSPVDNSKGCDVTQVSAGTYIESMLADNNLVLPCGWMYGGLRGLLTGGKALFTSQNTSDGKNICHCQYCCCRDSSGTVTEVTPCERLCS